jgi:hypothetical protein
MKNIRTLLALFASATFAFADTVDHVGSDELAREAATLLESRLPQAAAAAASSAAFLASAFFLAIIFYDKYL